MKAIIILLTVLLAGCGPKFKFNSPAYIDSAFRPYVACFKANYPDVSGKLGITFGSEDEATGRCNKYMPNKKRDIVINPFDWSISSAVRREFIIFHEMGHCVMYIGGHDDDTFNYMNSNTPIGETILEHREQLYLDFFGEDYELCDLSFDEAT